MKNKQIKYINLNNLGLDVQNPRLPESFRKNISDESDIIQWMLEDSSIIELMLAIGQNGFFIGEPLLVVSEDGSYIVVEGNRRLSSLKILDNPSLAKIHTRKVKKVLEETTYRPIEIPCIIFDSRDKISQYLGYRHVTGVKSWGMLSKARYLNSLVPILKSKGLSSQARELAKKIGSRSDYIKRVLISYKIYEIIKDNNFYKIPQLNENSFHFSYISESLRYENIKNFINIDFEDDNTLVNINQNNLGILVDWFFRKNDQLRSRVLGDSENLTKLNQLLLNEKALNRFKNGLSLDEAFQFITIDAGTLTAELHKALQSLKNGNSYIYKIEKYNDRDIEILKEIVNICKTMRNTINNKDDDWGL